VPALQIQVCLPTKRTKVPGKLRVRRDGGCCRRCRSEELLTCPIIALGTGAVAKALSSRARPILILDIAHKAGKAIEEASDPKVVDHVEQAKLEDGEEADRPRADNDNVGFDRFAHVVCVLVSNGCVC